MYIYIFIYMCIYIFVYMYIYTSIVPIMSASYIDRFLLQKSAIFIIFCNKNNTLNVFWGPADTQLEHRGSTSYRVTTICRLRKMTRLFCKKDPWKHGFFLDGSNMSWNIVERQQFVGSLKYHVSFAKEPCANKAISRHENRALF